MKNIEIENIEKVIILSINRQGVLNALNTEVLLEIKCFLEESIKQNNIDGLILTGKGEKSFIAGADIKEMSNFSPEEMLQFCTLGQNITNLFSECSFITIAAVNGYALGGGLEMALACDFIYASENAIFGLPEVSLGIIPGFGGTQRLSRAIGTRRAKELITTGKKINVEEAYNMGFINKICKKNELILECKKTIHQISKYSSFATSNVKKLIDIGIEIPLKEALNLEKAMCALCFSTEEKNLAIEKFLNKKLE